MSSTVMLSIAPRISEPAAFACAYALPDAVATNRAAIAQIRAAPAYSLRALRTESRHPRDVGPREGAGMRLRPVCLVISTIDASSRLSVNGLRTGTALVVFETRHTLQSGGETRDRQEGKQSAAPAICGNFR